MKSVFRQPLVMPEQVEFVSLKDLPEKLRKQLGGDEDDFALSRIQARETSKLINGELASLIEYFRSPQTIVNVVAQYSHKHKVDAEQILEESFPMLSQLITAGFLLPENEVDRISIGPTLKPTDRFADHKIIRCIQSLDDTELYQAQNPDGTFVALKLSRPTQKDVLKGRLEREAAILKHLDGRVNPQLLAIEETQEKFCLAMKWCSGTDSATAASELRQMSDWSGLLRLLIKVARAYTKLHGQKIIHCDVHPRNLLVDRNGVVKIIDFGLSDFKESDLPPTSRGGISFFYDPEYAAALLQHRIPPRASSASEQYSVAALLYFLTTGQYCTEFNLERETMLKQITNETPMPFKNHGINPWPELEAVLARAMSKQSEDRYKSMNAFGEALMGVSPPSSTAALEHNGNSEKVLEPMLEYLDPDGELFRKGLPAAPTCSVNVGMAGIAYALYRIACSRNDPKLLSMADLWLGKTIREQESKDAFINTELELSPENIGYISPYHCASGVQVVRAMISHSFGDRAEMAAAIAFFIEAVQQPCTNRDLTLGSLGIVLACSLLIEISPKNEWLLSDELTKLGNEQLNNIWKEVDGFDSIVEGKDWPNVGIAHGWAGLLYTTLRWYTASGSRLPHGFKRRMGELADCARPTGRGLSWPWRSEQGGEITMPGWCNGAAGFVFLGCLAHRLLGDETYLKLAEGAAWQAWEEGSGIIDLCCGLAGRAYSLLCLYQHSGDLEWLKRAEILAYRAADLSKEQRSVEHPRYSLYKGELGLAVLLAELKSPQQAFMPMFGEDKWKEVI